MIPVENSITHFYIYGYDHEKELISILDGYEFKLAQKIPKSYFDIKKINCLYIEYKGPPLRPGLCPKSILTKIKETSTISFNFKGQQRYD